MSAGITVALARRLLADAPWAQARLRPFAGHPIAWDIAGLRGSVVLDSDGLPAPEESTADGNPGSDRPSGSSADAAGAAAPRPAAARRGVRLQLHAADLPRIGEGMEALMRCVAIEGNAGLASELAFIARNLQLDPADWLAPWLGDVLAERAGQGLRSGAGWAWQAGRRAAAVGAEFAVHEARLLPDPAAVAAQCREIDELREAADRLAQRIARLERGR